MMLAEASHVRMVENASTRMEIPQLSVTASVNLRSMERIVNTVSINKDTLG